MKIRAADLTVHHVGEAIEAQASTDEGSYAISGRIVRITFAEDEIYIGVREKPGDAVVEWEFTDDELIDLIHIEA